MPSNNFKLGEMLNKRSPFSKTWINFDGSYTTEIFNSTVHFQDYEGNLHNIDTNLFDEADLFDYDGPIEKYGKDDLEVTKDRCIEDRNCNKLNRDNYDFQGLKVPFLAKLPRNFKRGYKIGHGENVLKFKPVGASPSKGYVDEEKKNCIHYQDAWNDADVCLELTEKGIKETIILKTDRSPNKFSFEVSGPLEDDLTAGTMKLENAWLEDAEGTKRDVSQTIRREGEDTFIDLEADVVGLVYPIFIDPTITIQPDATAGKDTYVNEGSPTNPQGTDTQMIINGPNAGTKGRALLQFDVSSIPQGVFVSSGNLILTSVGQTDATPINITTHKILAAWSESAVTWNNQPAHNSTAVSTTNVGNSVDGTTTSWEITSLADDWVNGVSVNNNGVLLKGPENTSTLKQFATSDHATTSKRPKLEIIYNIPPTAPTVTAPNGGETWNSSHTVQWGASNDLNYDDSTLVNTIYATYASARPQKLSNGWVVTASYDQGTTRVYFHVDKQDGQGFTQLCYSNVDAILGLSLTKKGTRIYCVVTGNTTANYSITFDAATVTNTNVGIVVLDSVQTANSFAGISIEYSPTDNKLKAAWSSKNSTYPNSNNIRYAEAILDVNNIPTWGSITQITGYNTSSEWQTEPVIVLNKNNETLIVFHRQSGTDHYIVVTSPTANLAGSPISGMIFRYSMIYFPTGYAQSAPTAIFVPQSINGLANGRIWVAWQGVDSTDSGKENIRVSFSDDGGVTWSGMQKLTSGNTVWRKWPSLTVNAAGQVSIIYSYYDTGDVRKLTWNGSWSAETIVLTTGLSSNYAYPSTLLDLTATGEPQFIYKAVNKTAYRGYVGTLTTNLQYHIQLTTNNGGAWKDIVTLTAAGATSYTYNFISEAESSLCKIRIRAFDGSAYGPYDESNGVFTIVHNAAPNAPTNLIPSSGVIDRTIINRLSWAHNDPNGGDPQSKFDLQYRLQGAGSWTTVNNQTTPNNYYDVPANTLPAGVIEWQVRTYDQAGLSGPYSTIAAFNAANPPAPATFVTPSEGATVAIANPVIQWSHPSQTDYDVKVMDTTGNTVIWEDIKTSTNKAVTVGVNLANQTSYKIKVRVKDSGGIWSTYTIVNINVSYTPPPIPILSTIKDDERGSITLMIDNPTPGGTEPEINYNDVFRRENGGEWVRVAANIVNDGSFIDYEPKPNASIDYYVISYGANGTYRESGVTNQMVNVAHTQISMVSNPSIYVTMKKGTTLSKRNRIESEKMNFAGRPYQLTEFGTNKEKEFDYKYLIFDWADLEKIEYLAEVGEVLLLRDHLGRKEYVTIDEVSIEEGARHWEISIKPVKVYYVEGV